MIFYVYMDPKVLSTENLQHEYATQVFIGILRGFLQNCLIAEFEDYRVQEAIKTQVKGLPHCFDRKIIKKLLSTLMKRNRFIYCFTPDHSGIKSDFMCVLEQAVSNFLDLLLVEEIDDGLDIPDGVEIATVATYQNTDFEAKRSYLGSKGRTLKEGELNEADFLNQCFGKALRFANRIEICDRLFGTKFGDNYEYTIKAMLEWLETILSTNPNNCKLVFHCGKPDGRTDNHMKTQLISFRRGRLKKMPIEIQFYQLPHPQKCLPHERFILTDQIVLEIGRGMDFLNKKTRRNRDTSISYKSLKETDSLLKSYAHAMLPRISI